MSVIEWTQNSVNFLNKLDEKEADRIVRKVNEIKKIPKRFIHGLINKDFGKIRIGDYRLFVDFVSEEDKLIIRTIKHRKNAYKK